MCQRPLTVLKCFRCSISADRSPNPVAGTFWLHSLKTPFSDEILQFRFQAQFLILLAGYGAEVSAQTGEGLQIQTPGEDSFLFSPLSPFRPLCGSVHLRFEKHYGKWRAVIAYVVAKYLDCGMLKNGYAVTD